MAQVQSASVISARTWVTPWAMSSRWASWLMRSLPRMNLTFSVMGACALVFDVGEPAVELVCPIDIPAASGQPPHRGRRRTVNVSWMS
jgi:hypothetical protein